MRPGSARWVTGCSMMSRRTLTHATTCSLTLRPPCYLVTSSSHHSREGLHLESNNMNWFQDKYVNFIEEYRKPAVLWYIRLTIFFFIRVVVKWGHVRVCGVVCVVVAAAARHASHWPWRLKWKLIRYPEPLWHPSFHSLPSPGFSRYPFTYQPIPLLPYTQQPFFLEPLHNLHTVHLHLPINTFPAIINTH